MILGIDFDNTIADYGSLMCGIASQWGLVGHDHPETKAAVRDSIRRLPNGELHWRRLQSAAYGTRMREAKLMPGAGDLLLTCKRHGVPVYVVSHKTEYSNLGGSDTNLRTAALMWLESHGFFDPHEFALERSQVFFHDTREEKIGRITTLGITHFIDDLEELFREPLFPKDVVPILLAPRSPSSRGGRIHSFASWDEITEFVFAGNPAFEALVDNG